MEVVEPRRCFQSRAKDRQKAGKKRCPTEGQMKTLATPGGQYEQLSERSLWGRGNQTQRTGKNV